MIASNKLFTEGHKYRNSLHAQFGERFSIERWGRGYKSFESKKDALIPYCFSIAVENMKAENYFTSTLTDCFATKTVPIYCGAPNIGEFFDTDGMLCFNTKDELEVILSSLTSELYSKMLPTVEKNFKTVKKYASTDDMFVKELERCFAGNVTQ